MSRLATALLIAGALSVAGTAWADDTTRRSTPVQVSMPGAVLRAAARRPGVAIALARAAVTPVSAGPLASPLGVGERAGGGGATFVDRITRSVSGERF